MKLGICSPVLVAATAAAAGPLLLSGAEGEWVVDAPRALQQHAPEQHLLLAAARCW